MDSGLARQIIIFRLESTIEPTCHHYKSIDFFENKIHPGCQMNAFCVSRNLQNYDG